MVQLIFTPSCSVKVNQLSILICNHAKLVTTTAFANQPHVPLFGVTEEVDCQGFLGVFTVTFDKTRPTLTLGIFTYI